MKCPKCNSETIQLMETRCGPPVSTPLRRAVCLTCMTEIVVMDTGDTAEVPDAEGEVIRGAIVAAFAEARPADFVEMVLGVNLDTTARAIINANMDRVSRAQSVERFRR